MPTKTILAYCGRFVGHWARSLGTAVLAMGIVTASAHADNLSDDDVSWLFPAPQTPADLANLIAIKDVGGANPVWSADAFQAYLTIAEGDSKISGTGQIGLPLDAHKISAWFIAGVRIDPGAPGLSPDIAAQFGQLPEVRLIVQPITVSGNTVTVHDYAAHLIFDFIKPMLAAPPQHGCIPQMMSNKDEFNKVLSDVRAFKSDLAAGLIGGTAVPTTGLPLGVHPGLSNPATAAAVAQRIKVFLNTHLPLAILDAMSAVGVPQNGPAPWFFVSMAGNGKAFQAIPSPALDGKQTAMALMPVGSPVRVVPTPVTNNGVLVTSCKSAAGAADAVPMAMRHGVSTAALFAESNPLPDEITAVTGTIASPERSHFFNTDCVSCHTETRELLGQHQVNPGGIDPSVLPKDDWVVRNFGWAPTTKRSSAAPSVTRRTEQETHAIVDFLNSTPRGP